jgi:hypothetical protein
MLRIGGCTNVTRRTIQGRFPRSSPACDLPLRSAIAAKTAEVSKYSTFSAVRISRQGGQMKYKPLNLIENTDSLGV